MANSLQLGIMAELEKKALKNLEAILSRDLPKRVLKQGIKKAAQKAMKPVIEAAKSQSPVFYGFLKRSVGAKVKSYRDGRLTVSLVGIKSGSEFTAPDGETKKPSKYLHLVVKGTDHSGGNDFLTPALEAHQAEVKQILFSNLEDEIMKASAAFKARQPK